MRGHLYNQLTETKEYGVGDRIQGRASLREKLRIKSMSGSTLTHAEDIMDDVSGYDAAELLNNTAEAAVRSLTKSTSKWRTSATRSTRRQFDGLGWVMQANQSADK